VRTSGFEGAKESLGQARALLEVKVGELKAAVSVAEGYMGIMNSLLVAVAKRPEPIFSLELEPEPPEELEEEEEEEELDFLRVARMAPTTPPAMTRSRTGIPNYLKVRNYHREQEF
jgi:hypothetical protein